MDYSTPTPIPDEPRYGSGDTERCAKTTLHYDPASIESLRGTLLELEGFANELIAEGAQKLRFTALNIPDRHRNPDAKLWQLRVVGLRAKAVVNPV